MVSIDLLKKAWTIVHGFDLFLKKACTIVHGFERFFEKPMDYSSWFSSIF